jgi:hypothetical protein
VSRRRSNLALQAAAVEARNGSTGSEAAVVRVAVVNRARLRPAQQVKVYVESVQVQGRRLPLPILPGRWIDSASSDAKIGARESGTLELLAVEAEPAGRTALSTVAGVASADCPPGLYRIRLAVVSRRARTGTWGVDLSMNEPSPASTLLERIQLSPPYRLS